MYRAEDRGEKWTIKNVSDSRAWLEEEITIVFPVSLQLFLVSSILKLLSTTANFHFIVLCSKVLTHLHSVPTIFRCKTFVYGIGNNNIFKYGIRQSNLPTNMDLLCPEVINKSIRTTKEIFSQDWRRR